MSGWTKWLPPLAVALGATGFLAAEYARSTVTRSDLDLEGFAKLPVQEAGRVKPMDSLARNTLAVLSEGRSEFKDAEGNKQPPVRWLLDVATGKADTHELFRIDNDQVLRLLKLPRRPGYRYSYREIMGQRDALEQAVDEARRADEKKRDLYLAKVLELEQKIGLYVKMGAFAQNDRAARAVKRLLQILSPAELAKLIGAEPGRAVYALLYPEKNKAEELQATVQDGLNRLAPEIRDLMDRREQPPQDLVIRYQFLYSLQTVLRDARAEEAQPVPPADGGDRWDKLWRVNLVNEVGREAGGPPEAEPAAAGWNAILDAYSRGDASAFNRAVADYQGLVAGRVPGEQLERARVEDAFNHAYLFYYGMLLYGLAGLLACVSWVVPVRAAGVLNSLSLWLVLYTLAVHTVGLLVRIYLQGRPPVTNLYSTGPFIGWGAVTVGLAVERFFGRGIGNALAATLGVMTLFIAHQLDTSGLINSGTGSGDTMEMMQAVLDTNFWLATHVTCMNLGYMATFVTGFLGIAYVVWGVCTPRLDRASAKSLGQITYGVACFATLLSFVGTVLGGIWADQSWGRFWGWDPKENGAVLVVIWNALILHARWAGLVRERGTALLAIAGNMVAVWSWFGTNQLGVGLHAYGFSRELAAGCRYAWLSHLAVIGLGLIPQRYWWSSRAAAAEAPRPGTPRGKARSVPVAR
jgi:ABC-type transport system involved in cytochrome c biogenesis permease subunit